jgi:transposase, IS30 family
MVTISERPAQVENRAVPGFWEDNLMIDKDGKSQIAALSSAPADMSCLFGFPTTEPRSASPSSWLRKWKPFPTFSATA